MIITHFWLNARSKIYSGVWQLSHYSGWVIGLNNLIIMLRGQTVYRGFSLFQNAQNGPGVHLSSYLTVTRAEGAFPTVNLHLAPRLWMRGARPPLSPYVFNVWTGITLVPYGQTCSCDHELVDCSSHTTVVVCWWNYYWWAKSSICSDFHCKTSHSLIIPRDPAATVQLANCEIQLDVIL